jgi:glycosyltransferase involved in cell wall biosynthesis
MSARTGNLGSAGLSPSNPLERPLPAPPAVAPRLAGKRVGMVVFSLYPYDPRPRRAAEALLKEGMEVDLICEGDERSPKHETLGRLEIVRIPIRHYRGGFSSYAYQYAAFISYSAAILAWRSLRRRYDLLYVHNMHDVLVLSAMVPKLLGAKVVLDQHDPMPELMRTIFNLGERSVGVRLIQRLERWSMARADLVITVNVACKRIFSERSCGAEKIGVVMNSPDGAIFPYREASSYPMRTPGQPFVIMYHGSLVERNGLELAVDALARLQKTIPEIELRVYGRSTPYLEQVMAKVHTLRLDDHVCYRGPKTPEELVHEIEACDVGVVPNQRNTFTDVNTPTRIFEYLALGKPVIAPCTPGIQDYFDSKSLIFFESGNAQQLAERLEYLASHAGEAAAIAERGQKVYLAHTWQRERENLVSLVAGLIKPRTATGAQDRRASAGEM